MLTTPIVPAQTMIGKLMGYATIAFTLAMAAVVIEQTTAAGAYYSAYDDDYGYGYGSTGTFSIIRYVWLIGVSAFFFVPPPPRPPSSDLLLTCW
jgi:hypothetical protein